MVKVFAPVNIAWIKYMGKEKGLPSNVSFSMMLDQLGTTTEMEVSPREQKTDSWIFDWSQSPYLPPENGIKKAEAFLNRVSNFKEVLEQFGFTVSLPACVVQIRTQNNVPAGTGIATSASGFAALTLAWLTLLVNRDAGRFKDEFSKNDALKKAVAKLSSLGSGSACRSFLGPFVTWDPETGVSAFLSKQRFTDFILIFETEQKKVSSSEAHERVKTSPLFVERQKRVLERLKIVQTALEQEQVALLTQVVRDEALEMHELFHTSTPPFSYFSEESKKWIQLISNRDQALPTQNAILTLDAGANVHLFVEESEESRWEEFLSQQNVSFLKAKAGMGAHYAD